jgi:hypothetical protein
MQSFCIDELIEKMTPRSALESAQQPSLPPALLPVLQRRSAAAACVLFVPPQIMFFEENFPDVIAADWKTNVLATSVHFTNISFLLLLFDGRFASGISNFCSAVLFTRRETVAFSGGSSEPAKIR